MAMRIHVVGAYGATEAEFRALLDSIDGEGRGSQRFRVGSSGKWMWANASVWQVGGGAIDEALDSLSVPALRVTSSDAVLWTVTLTGAGNDSFHGVHHFTQVGAQAPEHVSSEEIHDDDFPEDELEEVAGINRFIRELAFLWDAEEEARLQKEYAEEQAAAVEGLDDYVDYGVSLPPAVIEEMKRHPHRAHDTAFVAHGPQIVEALDRFGFEFDRAEMLRLLTVGPLTDLESDSDIGNMPRFLSTLGIEGVFQEEPEVAEETSTEENATGEHEEETRDWSAYPPGPLFEKVAPLIADCELTEIAGGPVKLTHVASLHLLAHMFAEHPTISVLIELPDDPHPSWQDLPELEVRQSDSQSRLCFATPTHWWFHAAERDELESNDLAMALGTVPPGTRFELTFVLDGLAEKCHRYAGSYRGQCVELDRAYPAVTAAVLEDALKLIEQIFGSQAIEFNSSEEEAAVRRNYERSQGEVPRIRNDKIMPQYGSRDDVIQTLLFERFDELGPWDIVGARRLVEDGWELFETIINPDGVDEDDDDEDEDESLDEASCDELAGFNRMLQEMSETAERMNEANVVPHGEDVVYEGRTGKFLRAAMSDLKHVSEDLLREHDSTMASLGFRFIGDFVGDADQRQEITRSYVGQHALALHGHRNENNQFGWADVSNGAVLVDFSQGTVEFHTHFENGMTLVTTSIDATHSKPEAGIYIRAYEDVSATTLWEKHLDGIDRFKQFRETAPVDHTVFSDPVRYLGAMDGLFCRFMDLA